jgi:hypothetical protein
MTYAYQWFEWSPDPKERAVSVLLTCLYLLLTTWRLIQGFLNHSFILRTLALAHLTSIKGNEDDDGGDGTEKPIGALILAMQAVRDE